MRSFLGESGRPRCRTSRQNPPPEIPAEIPIHNSKALKSIKATMTHGAADLIPAGNKIARTIIAKIIMITSISENPFGQFRFGVPNHSVGRG